jgi:hypothetical protein
MNTWVNCAEVIQSHDNSILHALKQCQSIRNGGEACHRSKYITLSYNLRWHGHSRCSSTSVVTRLCAGRSGFVSWQGQSCNFFPLRHRVQNDSGAHAVSYSRGMGGIFPGRRGKGARMWILPLTSTPQYIFMAWYLIKQDTLYGVVLS